MRKGCLKRIRGDTDCGGSVKCRTVLRTRGPLQEVELLELVAKPRWKERIMRYFVGAVREPPEIMALLEAPPLRHM